MEEKMEHLMEGGTATQIPDIESCLFPRVNAQLDQKQAKSIHSHQFEWSGDSKNAERCLMKAWSIILEKYTDSHTARFGVVACSTDTGKADIQEWSASLGQKDCTAAMIKLNMVQSWSFDEAMLQGRFNTCLVFEHQREWLESWTKLPDHPVAIAILSESIDHNRIFLHARSNVVDKKHLIVIGDALQHILHCISKHLEHSLESLDLIPPEHYQQIHKWNQSVPKEPVNTLVHSLVQRRCRMHPDKQAICAWDGDLTYGQVDQLASDVARELKYRGVRPEIIVPLLFDKSKWTAVAMLGVLKAGGAFVLLDSEHPIDRLEGICRDVEATIILTSSMYREIGSRLGKTWSVPDLLETSHTNGVNVKEHSPSVHPRNTAYLSFTSGSTGKPKGVVIEHASICTNVLTSSDAHNLKSSSRVLQFASYAFDVSIHETLFPLMLGGCVCIPSAAQRVNQLQEAIAQFGVTWLELTPSVSRLLDPDSIPNVKTLVVGGESISPSEIARWSSKVRLINAYGPAECTIVSTVNSHMSPCTNPSNIGRGYGGTTWIVSPDNHDKLVPIGAAGELIIGGPIVARGYLHQPQQTAKSFIMGPLWTAEKESRFYKTGDLVRQQSDGCLIYLGRKDTQVKLRGQRIELGEIEHHAGTVLPGLAVAAEVGNLYHGRSILVLFVEWQSIKRKEDDCQESSMLCKPTSEFAAKIQNTKTILNSVMPKYMIPELVIPLRTMPLSPTAKVDRKRLRNIISQLEKDDIRVYRMTESPSFMNGLKKATDPQNHILQLVAQVLNIAPEEIQPDDDFFQLGGDSISAIRLAQEARKMGVCLTTADIFRTPIISQLSQRGQIQAPPSPSENVPATIPPFSMLDGSSLLYQKLACEQCGILIEQIEDIYPCSPLQERLIARTIRQPGAFQARFTFQVSSKIDWARLKTAWNYVAETNPILRTRIIHVPQLQSSYNTLQVVIRGERIDWVTAGQSHQRDNKWESYMTFGVPLIYLVASTSDNPGNVSLVMHHALFDWWSYKQVMEDLDKAYRGQLLVPRTYVSFINHIYQLDAARWKRFWKQEFTDLQCAPIPHADAVSEPSSATIQLMQKEIHFQPSDGKVTAMPAKVCLALATTLAYYTGSRDVVFGLTVVGRSSVNAADVSGPTIATYPFRTLLQLEDSLADTLQRIQEHSIALMSFEQTGIQRIQTVGAEATRACDFDCLLVIQPGEREVSEEAATTSLWELEDNESWKRQSYQSFSTQPLSLVCEPAKDKLIINAFYDESILSPNQIQEILLGVENHFAKIIHQPQAKIKSVLGSQDGNESTRRRQLATLLYGVEMEARGFLGNRFQVAAERIIAKGSALPKLALFVGLLTTDETSNSNGFTILRQIQGHTRTMLLQLMKYLESKYAPGKTAACCIPVSLMYKPSVTHLLLDRAAVREMASKSTWTRLRAWENDNLPIVGHARSSIETKLIDLLASALGIEAQEIGLHDDFVSLGCDSLMAMQFVARCNQENIMVTVPDVFKSKCIAGLAAKIAALAPSLTSETDNAIEPALKDVEGIDQLVDRGQVIDIFPCTPSHRALFDQDAKLRAYTTWEVSSSTSIDPMALAEAWKQVVRRHATLRTILLPSRSHPSKFFHCVLKDSLVDMKVVVNVDDDYGTTIRQASLLNLADEVPYAFTIYQTISGRVFCKLEGRYAFLDATSVLILLRELGAAYHNGDISYQGPSYRSWATYMHQWNHDSSHIEFWKEYLHGAEPCFFPSAVLDSTNPSLKELRTYIHDLLPTRVLRDYCNRQNISITNALQLAWALVLKQYTNNNDVVFGTLVSGRDAPIPHVNNIVGSLFNLVVCRFSLDGKKTISQTLQENQHSMHMRMTHQHCSLTEVAQTCCEEKALFNTCLSVEQPLSSEAEIRFSEIETHEETEYDLVVTVTVSENIRVNMIYWSTFLTEDQAAELATVFNESIKDILSACS